MTRNMLFAVPEAATIAGPAGRRDWFSKRSAPALALAVILSAVAPLGAQEGNGGNPGIAPPHSEFRGRTYSEWSVAWYQWAQSLPTTSHPLFDTADCSEGQRGNVWFIGGKFGGKDPFPPAGRTCTVPAGAALFLPVASSWADNEGCDVNRIQRTALTEAELRAAAYTDMNNILSTPREIILDGVAVHGVPVCDPSNPSTCQSPYRVQSPVFNYTVPAFDNILELADGTCYANLGQPYTVVGAVADGLYVMIEPLPVGQHTVQFGKVSAPRLYNITVAPGKVN